MHLMQNYVIALNHRPWSDYPSDWSDGWSDIRSIRYRIDKKISFLRDV